MALNEGQHTGEFILSEANGNRSRDNVTVTVPSMPWWRVHTYS